MQNFRNKVNLIFSDTVMIALALLIIPVAIAQNLLTLSPSQEILISVIDWFIWIAFFLEFTLKFIAAEKRWHWLTSNKLDSIVSLIVILSPLLEFFSDLFAEAALLRLLRLGRLTRLSRLSRLIRLVRLIALGSKVKHGWRTINLKAYVAFFLVAGMGFTASFIATGFQHSTVDVTWISLFVSIFGVFYAFLISFFVMHIWSKFNSIGGEISKEVNALRNAYLLSFQLLKKEKLKEFSLVMTRYIEEVFTTIWNSDEMNTQKTDEKFLKLIYYFNDFPLSTQADIIALNHIIEELRLSSVSQANLINLANDKTPKILWILFLLLSTVLVSSFIFLGFQNQLLATALITLVSIVTGLVVALIFDIDTPFQAGFWNISPKPFLSLKEYINKNIYIDL